MQHSLRSLAFGLVILVATAACGGLGSDADTAAAVNRVKEGMEGQAAGAQAYSAQSAQAGAALSEAARTFGLAPGQVTVEKVEPVQWNDTSLGCPDVSKTFAPASTPGVRFVVAGGGKRGEVHMDAAGRMVVCEKPTQ